MKHIARHEDTSHIAIREAVGPATQNAYRRGFQQGIVAAALLVEAATDIDPGERAEILTRVKELELVAAKYRLGGKDRPDYMDDVLKEYKRRCRIRRKQC